MTRAASLRSINCTSCGAGLDVLGGGRVKVQVCGYCGSELDAQDEYRVLRTFADAPRPDSPFHIGMQGMIDGVLYTIIGTLGMQESWAGRTWRWTDHQLFSPTHGYAVLTAEETGHLTLTRRFRKPTRPRWITTTGVEIAEHPPKIRTARETFTYYETTTSEITFAEGEFNWRPKVGAQSTSITLMSQTAKLSFLQSGSEEEVYRTRYLPHAGTCTAFGLSDVPAPVGVHPLSPYTPGRHEGFLKWTATLFCLIALGLTLVLLGQSRGQTLTSQRFDVSDLPAEIEFEITRTDQLARIDLSGDVNNAWAELGLFLTGPDDVPVFEAERLVERYSGRDQDGAWTEGNGRASLRFIPRVAGTYMLEVTVEDSRTWSGRTRLLSRLQVRVAEAVIYPLWMGALAVLFGLFAAYHHGRSSLHKRRRWWGTDWSD